MADDVKYEIINFNVFFVKPYIFLVFPNVPISSSDILVQQLWR